MSFNCELKGPTESLTNEFIFYIGSTVNLYTVVRTVDRDSGSDEDICHMHTHIRNSKAQVDHMQATSWNPSTLIDIRAAAF